MFMIHGIDQMQDVPGKKQQSEDWEIYLTTFSDGSDAFNCVLPGFHVSYHLRRVLCSQQLTIAIYSAQLLIS